MKIVILVLIGHFSLERAQSSLVIADTLEIPTTNSNLIVICIKLFLSKLKVASVEAII